jgi:hypothetical protein
VNLYGHAEKNDVRFLSLCEATDLENRGCPGPVQSFHTPGALFATFPLGRQTLNFDQLWPARKTHGVAKPP